MTMTMLDIISDTVNFYNEDPIRRAVSETKCEYITSTGKQCAFGRFMSDAGLGRALREGNNGKSCGNFNGDFDKYLRPEVHGYSEDFWRGLQYLHDGRKNWDEDGLTWEGILKVGSLIRDHCPSSVGLKGSIPFTADNQRDKAYNILKETVDYYRTNPKRRGVTDLGCAYITQDGKQCALGRYLSDEGLGKIARETSICGVSAVGLNEKFGLDTLLNEEARGLSAEFWLRLQAIHDTPTHWTQTDISAFGCSAVAELAKSIYAQ